jgi:hypothetical protein
MSENKEYTALWDLYKRGIAYQSSMGLRTLLPRCVKFYEGDQWPTATADTANMPRPVVNIVKRTCRSKKASILATPVRLVYKAETAQDQTLIERFNDFADYIQKEYGQRKLDRRAMKDAVVEGTYIFHYYWDAEATGLDGVIRGGVRCDILNALDVIFADPTQIDEQKQEWILIVSRENVRKLREGVKNKQQRDQIVPDERDENPYNVKEQDEDGLCTVLTRYFRRDGEVYCERATKGVIIAEPFPIAPRVEEIKREITEKLHEEEVTEGLDGAQVDAPNNNLSDDTTELDGMKHDTRRAPLYPIVVGQYEPRKNCIYGQGEAEALLPNQRALNNNLAMMLYNTQQVAWNRMLVIKGALGDQEITNEPGEVLIDYSGTGNGIRNMPPAQMSTMPLTLTQNLMELTRDASGVTEVMTGETISGSMSGAAIAQLQGQAMVPIEDLRQAFWEVKERQGMVLAQFFKLFYHGAPYVREVKAEKDEPKYVLDHFNGEDYRDIKFDVIVETVGGSRFTNAGDITALDSLYAKGEITAAEYIEAYPDDALSNKQTILEILQKRDNTQAQLQQMTAQIEQLQGQLQQTLTYVAENQKAMDGVDSVLRENKTLKEMLAALYGESAEKINAANVAIEASNRQIMQDKAQIDELQTDAGAMAMEIARARGIIPGGGGQNAVPRM